MGSDVMVSWFDSMDLVYVDKMHWGKRVHILRGLTGVLEWSGWKS